jgi:hypothetical protein
MQLPDQLAAQHAIQAPENLIFQRKEWIMADWSLSGNGGTNPSDDFLGTTDIQPLVVRTNKAEVMRVSAGGQIGVGTTNPEVRVHVRGNRIRLQSLDEQRTLDVRADGAALDIQSAGAPLFINNTDQSTFINPRQGSVGIGTTSPNFKLHVVGTNFASAIVAESPDGLSAISAIARGQQTVGLFASSRNDTAVVAESDNGTFILTGEDGNTRRFAVVRATGAVLADGPHTGPADYAEMLPAAGVATDFEPGDVLIIGPDGKMVKADSPYAPNLAGVYSSAPGFVADMRITTHGIGVYEDAEDEAAEEFWLPVTLMGVVPAKVTATEPVRPGDLLTSSATPGHAMRATPIMIDDVAIYPTGTILGKALEPFESGSGRIRVLVTLQ